MDELFEAARRAREKAYAPFSMYRVGAALRDDRGDLYLGCNVENSSYPEGSCAEANAIGAMLVGGGQRIEAIAIVGGHDEPEACTPCGGCRQRIAEFADDDTQIWLIGRNGERTSYRIGELLPLGFRLEQ
jgi:cytidine deaminase